MCPHRTPRLSPHRPRPLLTHAFSTLEKRNFPPKSPPENAERRPGTYCHVRTYRYVRTGTYCHVRTSMHVRTRVRGCLSAFSGAFFLVMFLPSRSARAEAGPALGHVDSHPSGGPAACGVSISGQLFGTFLEGIIFFSRIFCTVVGIKKWQAIWSNFSSFLVLARRGYRHFYCSPGELVRPHFYFLFFPPPTSTKAHTSFRPSENSFSDGKPAEDQRHLPLAEDLRYLPLAELLPLLHCRPR